MDQDSSSGITDINRETELHRLAHSLRSAPADLDFLESLDSGQLSNLNSRILKLQEDHSAIWARLSQVARFMPAFVNAKVAEEVLGAHITANLTYHIPVRDGISIAKHFSVKFMAEVADELLPERASELMNAMPMDILKKLVRYLLERENHYLLGSFTDYLEISKVQELLPEVRDDLTLLRITVFTRRKEHVARIVSGFPDDRIRSLIALAAFHNHWNEIFSVGRHLQGNDRLRIRKITGELSPELQAAGRNLARNTTWWNELSDLFP